MWISITTWAQKKSNRRRKDMADFMTILQKRRSVRRYEEKDVSEESLNVILESVKWAPSWANTQCWEIIVVRDQSVREDLQKAIFPKNPATKAIVSAPVLLALCGKLQSSGYYDGKAVTKFGDWFMFDLGIVAQTICLSAQAIGLGTVMVGLFDHDNAAKILNVPHNHEVVLLIPLGYPAKTPEAPKRREVNEYIHFNRF